MQFQTNTIHTTSSPLFLFRIDAQSQSNTIASAPFHQSSRSTAGKMDYVLIESRRIVQTRNEAAMDFDQEAVEMNWQPEPVAMDWQPEPVAIEIDEEEEIDPDL